MISCFLKEVFGSGVERLRIETQVIEASNRKIEFKTVSSNHHIEINPSDVGIYDRLVIQQLVKMNASVGVIHGADSAMAPIKVVVISEGEKLSREAQAALRRVMEKYANHFRTIISVDSCSRLIPAIKSRTLIIRVPAPSVEEITQLIMAVSRKEGSQLNQAQASTIAKSSDRNLRRAFMAAEMIRVTGRPIVGPVLPQWHMFLKALAGKILREQSPSALDRIRNDLYQLQAHMVPSQVILRFLLKDILETSKKENQTYLHPPLIELAAFYEARLRLGSKPIIHLEAFIAQFMTACLTYADEQKKTSGKK